MVARDAASEMVAVLDVLKQESNAFALGWRRVSEKKPKATTQLLAGAAEKRRCHPAWGQVVGGLAGWPAAQAWTPPGETGRGGSACREQGPRPGGHRSWEKGGAGCPLT